MSEAAAAVTGLRGTLALTPGEGEPRLAVESGSLRVAPAALALLLPPGLPLRLERRIAGGRCHFSGHWNAIPFHGEITPEGTAEGRLRLTVASVRVAGILPLPPGLVGALLGLLPEHPALRRADRHLELDLAVLLRPLGILLPPLRRVAASDGALELQF